MLDKITNMTDKIYIFQVFLFLSLFFMIACTQPNTNIKRKAKKEVFRQTYATFVEIDKINYNFDKVKGTKKCIRHQFVLKNKSTRPLYISDVISGCGCLSVKFSKRIFTLNDTASVSIEYMPGNRTGYYTQSVMVLLNDGRYYLLVSINGTI